MKYRIQIYDFFDKVMTLMRSDRFFLDNLTFAVWPSSFQRIDRKKAAGVGPSS